MCSLQQLLTTENKGIEFFNFHFIGWLIDLIDMYACGHTVRSSENNFQDLVLFFHSMRAGG